jgi:hypothetical protein
MPTWGGILQELDALGKSNIMRFDLVRRKYLVMLNAHTGRDTILYATNWTNPVGYRIDSSLITITEEDIEGLMEVIHGLNGKKLDLILHSPGGYPEATEAFVSYLRSKFTDIRVIIPYAAMSAATMLSCSADRIVMGKHSFIGPIDPQVGLQTQLGFQSVPAQAIEDQFGRAKKECEDPKNLNVWYPIIAQYGPALLSQCENATALSKELVSTWLQQHMFSKNDDTKRKAQDIADYLSNHKQFNSHSRHIGRDQAKELGLIIDDLEIDQQFQDLVLSVYHATTHTFTGGTGIVKIIENHLGKAFMKIQQVVQFGPPPSPPDKEPPKNTTP